MASYTSTTTTSSTSLAPLHSRTTSSFKNMMYEMVKLISLPAEILEKILGQCLPPDLAAVARSCHALNAYVSKNRLLYKEVYLSNYDQPPPTCLEDNLDWEQELQTVVRLQKILSSQDSEAKRENFWPIALAIQKVLKTAAIPTKTNRQLRSRNVALLTKAFEDRSNVDNLLCRSSLFVHSGYTSRDQDPDANLRQISAKLHVLYGVPVRIDLPRRKPLQAYARAKVYDLRNYTNESLWGPFMNDGTANVDWEKMECIMIDLGYNLRRFHEKTEGRFPLLWHTPFAGVSSNSFLSPRSKVQTQQPLNDLDHLDPFRISGTYMRVVCFLDYSDLHVYNFASGPVAPNEPRSPLALEEAVRIITMKIATTKIEPPNEDQDQAFPIVHFEGASRSMHAGWDPNANSSIRGTVSMTKEGEVRWTTFSVFHGEERWRSEGIQVGGVQSARGVWGHWFDIGYDPDGPVGPTAFWKLTDELPEPTAPSNVAVSATAVALEVQANALRNNSTAAYFQDVNSHGVSISPPHNAGRGSSRSIYTHPYMQSITNDPDDEADDGEISPELAVGGAGGFELRELDAS